MTVIVPLVSVIAGAGLTAQMFSRSQLVSLILPLATRFPLMIVTTLVVVGEDQDGRTTVQRIVLSLRRPR